MSARNPFKFSLKPSTLSQHTVNFNKILEEVPAPKLDSIILEKPKLAGVAIDVKPETPKNEDKKQPETKKEAEVAVSTPSFVFGESLTDRVVNVEQDKGEKQNSQSTNGDSKKDSAESNNLSDLKATPVFNKQLDTDHEKYTSDSLEIGVATLIRMNCKLFVLDKDSKDQANWSERGYGILKMIECDDGENCKIMMWTDKCFRLVLNTKLFESMTIEKVNRKSIRLNAQDDGTIRMFLIKCGHPNECEELSHKMISRLESYKKKMALAPKTDEPTKPKNEPSKMIIVLECNCEVVKTNDVEKQIVGKINIYRQDSYTEALYLDILNASDQSKVLSNRYLKSIKLDSSGGSDRTDQLVFEIKESFHVSFKVTIKTEKSVKEFLSFYEKVSKQTDETSSNNSVDNELTSDEEESDSESVKRNDQSQSLDSSVVETNKSDVTESTESQGSSETKPKEPPQEEPNQETVQVVANSKKRKNDDDQNEQEEIQNENVKKMSLAEKNSELEENSTCLKRSASGLSSQESNQEKTEKSIKKSKCDESPDN